MHAFAMGGFPFGTMLSRSCLSCSEWQFSTRLGLWISVRSQSADASLRWTYAAVSNPGDPIHWPTVLVANCQELSRSSRTG